MIQRDSRIPEQEMLAQQFASHIASWAQINGASSDAISILSEAARETSLATSDGHVCALLAEIISPSKTHADDARRLLLASGVVGTPAAPGAMPLILDDEGRIYLHRYFDYECKLASRIIAAAAEDDQTRINQQVNIPISAPATENTNHNEPDWQKIAVALALQRKLTIISGGPGTGKTSIVVHLLASLVAHHPECRIKLAAPTGKAAAKMLQAVRDRGALLPEAIRERLPKESFTLHRLLGVTTEEGVYRHNAAHPLALDVLIIDEASMLDIALAARVFDAIPKHARIVLLGDKDQLSAVEAGSVFAEISADPTLSAKTIASIASQTGIPSKLITPPPTNEPTVLQDSAVWLTRNYRFSNDSGISKLAACINAGEVEQTISVLREAHGDVQWIEDNGTTSASMITDNIMKRYATYLEILRSDNANPLTIFSAFDRFRVLCALREGPRGVNDINQHVGNRFRQTLNHPLDLEWRSAWYPGRPVMVLRNDYSLNLFNGDIGIALPDAAGNLLVHFPDAENSYRTIAPGRLPEHETAFAMTVHKAQGSEFEEIILLMPNTPSRVITRELLYTGITRARSASVLVASQQAVEAAVSIRSAKRSGLRSRMRDASC